MTTSAVSICNLAITRLGQSQAIAALTEASKAAQLCNVLYADCRDRVLRAHNWPFATRYQTLGLVEEAPNNDWIYSYRYPANCLRIHRLVTALGQAEPNPPAYAIASDSVGRLVLTNQPQAVAQYTHRIENPAEFDPLFASALAWLLAVELAGPLTGEDRWRVRAQQSYEQEIRAAQAAAGNEEHRVDVSTSSFEQARQ